MDDIGEIKARLLARLATLEHRVERLTDDLRHGSQPVEADFEEQATQRENEEVLGALDDAGRRELDAIRTALSRIEDGSYGRCRRCGEPISPRRLAALPTALECVACAR